MTVRGTGKGKYKTWSSEPSEGNGGPKKGLFYVMYHPFLVTLLPWTWRRQVAPKSCYHNTRYHISEAHDHQIHRSENAKYYTGTYAITT
jgi:hypothetical protein